MRNIFLSFIGMSLVVTSCDNTFEYAHNLATPPVLYFNGNSKSVDLTDSFKISLKTAAQNGISSPVYQFTVTGDDKDSPLKGIAFSINGGDGTLASGSQKLQTDLGSITPGQAVQLVFSTQQEGTYSIAFTGQNGYGASTTATLHLLVFTNLAPLAKFVATPATVFGKYGYQFDASSSRDRDRDFGGLVKVYKYTITSNNYGTQTITSDSPVTPLVFPGSGSFTVSLVVYDNDGAASDAYALPQPLTLQ